MNLTIEELNELIYCLAATRLGLPGQMVNEKLAEKLENKLRDELEYRIDTAMHAAADTFTKWG